MEQTKKPLPGAVLLLAALGFVLGTCEFVIVGILPEIAEGLNTSLAAVGKLVSVFAACYAVGTPVITAATGGISRRKLLAVLMGVFLLTSAASFAAPNVAVLYATRVVAALVSGTLTAATLTEEALRKLPQVEAVTTAAGHRPLHPESDEYRRFCRKQLEIIESLPEIDLSREKEFFNQFL